MSSIHSEIQCQPATNLPAPTDDRSGPILPAHQANDLDIPRNFSSSTKRNLPKESKNPDSKRRNVCETDKFSETTTNETSSASSSTVKNNSASSINQHQEQTPAPLQHNLETNIATMAAPFFLPRYWRTLSLPTLNSSMWHSSRWYILSCSKRSRSISRMSNAIKSVRAAIQGNQKSSREITSFIQASLIPWTTRDL